MVLKPATVEEQITVIAQSPTVDVKSTETASVTLGNEILRNIPNSQFSANIVLMAPGVNETPSPTAPGGERGISYQMDGVGVGDPDGGTAWVFVDYNIIEEAKVMGIGLPAEYGNFTGVIFNIVTKSGGNKFSGHFEFNRQLSGTKFWQAEQQRRLRRRTCRISRRRARTSSTSTSTSAAPSSRTSSGSTPAASTTIPRTIRRASPRTSTYKQPRVFLKLTTQLDPVPNISAAVEYDNYKGTYRGAGRTRSHRHGRRTRPNMSATSA